MSLNDAQRRLEGAWVKLGSRVFVVVQHTYDDDNGDFVGVEGVFLDRASADALAAQRNAFGDHVASEVYGFWVEEHTLEA